MSQPVDTGGQFGGWSQPYGSWSRQSAWPPQGAWPSQAAWSPPVAASPQAAWPGNVKPPLTPPARPSRLRIVLLGLIGLTVLALAGLVVAGLLSKPAEVAYQNDQYQVPPPEATPPPLPFPDTDAEAHDLVTKNTLYAQQAPLPVRCNEQPLPVDAVTDQQLKTHFENLIACMVRVWQPPVTQAGRLITRPTVTIYGDKINTKCGDSDVNAFYCSADQQLYFSNLLIPTTPGLTKIKWAGDIILGHEYGHLVQARAAILTSVYGLRANAATKDENLQIGRRKEQQADCLSGMFTRAVSRSLDIKQSELDQIEAVLAALGDDVLSGKPGFVGDHGWAENRRYWHITGLASSAISVCNTFVAPASRVR
jgi:predicted metalloprotease